MGPEITQVELVPAFVKLLRDSEAEVRTAASLKVTALAEIIPVDITVKNVLPCTKELVTDQNQHVRGNK